MDIELINKTLASNPDLVSLSLNIDPRSFKYNLNLTLSSSLEEDNPRINIEFFDISELNLDNLGGGLIQFHCLVVQKLDEQWDRKRFLISPLEDSSASFKCSDIMIYQAE